MMLQVKNWSKISNFQFPITILLAVLLFMPGCKDKNADVEDPFVTPGNTEDPGWVITVENDMTASMTAIVKVSFAQHEGTLAAFMGEDCCGIAQYKEENGLYWLYISPAPTNDERQTTNDIQLRFYSPDLKRIFDAKETFPFRNDTHLGTVAEPYTPEWQVH